MKRIVTIQDISCVGKCSLTVALPIISVFGIETAILPTAVLSNHTAFSNFTFTDLTKDILPISAAWKKEGFTFDAIYTGYLGSFEQIDLMKQFFTDFTGPHTLKLVDPCMADNGNLYKGFTVEFAHAMADLCASADVVVPNVTEAAFMLDIPYKAPFTYDESYIQEMIEDLVQRGIKRVVLKGVEYASTKHEHKIGIVSYDSKTKQQESYFHEKLDKSFHGTGDIFASTCLGALVRGFTLKEAYSLAADFVVESIRATLKTDAYNWYGVDFETALPYLVSRIFPTTV